MIAKSDFIILAISLSMLALGLYNHYELQGHANHGSRTSLVSSTLNNINKGSERLLGGAAQAWQGALAKITGNSSGQTSGIDESRANKPVTTALVQSPKITPSPSQPATQQAPQDPALSRVEDSATTDSATTTTGVSQIAPKQTDTEQALVPAKDPQIVQAPAQAVKAKSDSATLATRHAAVTRVPGNATVLIISPNGSSSSDAGKQESESEIAPINTQNSIGQHHNDKVIDHPATGTKAAEVISQSTVNPVFEPEAADKAVVPGKVQTELQAGLQNPHTEAPIRIYQVQTGETLTGIAKNLGTTVARLKEINQLADDRILAGQDLVYETDQTATEVN